MGDVILCFKSKELREKAERELRDAKGIVELKKVGDKALFVGFSSKELSPSLIANELKRKGADGVISSL